MTDMFTSMHFSEIQGNHVHLKALGADEAEAQAQTKQNAWFQMEEHQDGHSLYSLCRLYDQQKAIAEDNVNLFGASQQTTPQYWSGQTNSHHRLMTQAIQPIPDATQHEIEEDDKPQFSERGKPPTEKTHAFTSASLELLTNYALGVNNDVAKDENLTNRSSEAGGRPGIKLSLGEIVRVAGERYIQYFSRKKADGLFMFVHPYSCAPWDLSIEDTANVELVQLLLAAAESVGQRQFARAKALLTRCRWVASDSGNAVQRVVFYFAEALQGRVDIETGRTTLERINERANYAKRLEVDFNVSFLACHQELPFSKVVQFAAMQEIVESVVTANKIHLIDLHIRSGMHWIILMQALAERCDRPILKISAIGTTNTPQVEEAGKRLQSYAESLNLVFSFNSVSVSDMTELKEEMFKKQADEVVAVYSPLFLRTMISKPDSLRSLMRIIRRLRPVEMVVIETEANHNSPTFESRFTESLFFFSAYFDSLEDCMDRDNPHRKIIEEIYLGEGIRNMVGTEGDKRCTRNVKIEVWREYFARFGMQEMEFSEASMRYANTILIKFTKASSCTITNSGKGLIIRWKGTPIHSLTSWKFM